MSFAPLSEDKFSLSVLFFDEGYQQLGLLADAMPQLVWIAKPNGEVFYYNNRVQQFAGAKKGADGAWHWEGLLHEEDLVPTANAWKQAVLTSGIYEKEHRVQMKDGSFRWHLSRAFPQKNEKGEVIKWLGTATDIHEQKRVEEKIKEAEERWRTALEATEIGTWDFNPSTKTFFLSDVARKIRGIGPEVENPFTLHRETIHPDDVQYVANTMQTVVAQGEEKTFAMEYRVFKNTDNQLCWIRSVGRIIIGSNGKPQRVIGIMQDITEQKLAEELLKESEEQFRVLTNTIPQIVWVRSTDGKLQYLNDQWFNVTGQTPEDGLENRFAMVHPDDVMPLVEKWQQALQTGEAFQREFRLKDKSTGTYRWFFCNVQPLKDKEGNVLKWIGASTDIQHFKDASVLLEQQVQERTTELNHLNATLQRQTEELRRSNEDLQQFAHVASHDLKEPLRKIKTYGSRLNDEFGDMLPGEAKSFLEKMDAAATRMSSMIDGVLGYSMLGATEQVMETVDLSTLLLQIENDLEILIQQKEAVIQHQHLPVIEASAILIYQLFYNLINNALKFSKTGVAVKINISAQQIKGSDWKDGVLVPDRDYVQIEMEDNGIGFDQEHAQKIFKTFTRLNSKDKYEGTGLGLSLCQKIVQRHSGTIAAKGVLHQGAVFTIILPLKQSV